MIILSEYKTLKEKEEVIRQVVKARCAHIHDEDFTVGDLGYDAYEQSYFLPVAEQPENPLEIESNFIQLDRHAETQLLNRLKLPANYIYRCTPELKAHNLNEWLNFYKDKQIKLRWLDDHVRAVFSSRYSTDLDDHILLPVALKALRAACEDPDNNLHLKDFQQANDFTILKALFKDQRINYKNDLYFAGVTIVNSEVGKSSIWIRPMIRSGNAYGAYDFIDASREGTISIRHLGNLNTEKVHTAITKALKVASVGIYQLMEAGKTTITNPIQTVKDLVEDSNYLTQRMVYLVKEEYKDKQTANKLEFAKTMLNAIKTLPLFQQHLAEQAVGRYLDLFNDTDSRFELIANNLTQQLSNI